MSLGVISKKHLHIDQKSLLKCSSLSQLPVFVYLKITAPHVQCGNRVVQLPYRKPGINVICGKVKDSLCSLFFGKYAYFS